MSAGTEGKDGSANTSSSSDLRVRTFSAVVLMPPAVVIVYVGGIFYTAGIAALAYLLLMEWCSIVSHSERKYYDRMLGLGLVLALMIAGYGYWQWAGGLLATIVALALSARLTGHATNWLAAGVCYSGVACFSLLLLRQGESGAFNVLFLLAIVWSTDIGAYLVGRTLGGPKLWPAISPKKTWSGSVGGLIFGFVAGIAICAVYDFTIDLRIIVIIALLSIATEIGDLIESGFKRSFSIKDTGNLIPGHGGVLDRLDGLLLAAIVAMVIGGLESGFSAPSNGFVIGY